LFNPQADHQDIPSVLLLVINLIFLPSSKLFTYEACDFSCSGPAVWNNLHEYHGDSSLSFNVESNILKLSYSLIVNIPVTLHSA